MTDVKAWVYFGTDTNALEERVQDVIQRGGEIISASIAYGPSPAKIAGARHGQDSWHVLVVVNTEHMDPTL